MVPRFAPRHSKPADAELGDILGELVKAVVLKARADGLFART